MTPTGRSATSWWVHLPRPFFYAEALRRMAQMQRADDAKVLRFLVRRQPDANRAAIDPEAA